MSPLKEYRVTLDGLEYTMQLDEETAKRYKAEPVEAKSRTPANKSRRPSNK